MKFFPNYFINKIKKIPSKDLHEIIIRDLNITYYDVSTKKLDMIKQATNFLMDLMNPSINVLNKSKTRIYLYGFKEKKEFPLEQPIRDINANSGLTIWNQDGTMEVYIYRDEEMVKVYIHELLHLFGMDGTGCAHNFQLDGIRNPCEGIVEFAAEILYNNLFNGNSDKEMKRQVDFSIRQAIKIMCFHDIRSIYEPFRNGEETNIRAYYLLKTELFLCSDGMKIMGKLLENEMKIDKEVLNDVVKCWKNGILNKLFKKWKEGIDVNGNKKSLRMTIYE